MPMLIDLNAAKFRDPFRRTPLAIGLLYFFAFGQRIPQFYKIGLVHQSRDWRNLWYMFDGRRTAHIRAFGANSKLLLPWSFVFVSPSHGFLWYAERRIKEYLRDEKAWARSRGDSGYTETFSAALLDAVLEVMGDAKGVYLAGEAPARFDQSWSCLAEALVSRPLSLDQIRTLLTEEPLSSAKTVARYIKKLHGLTRTS